VIVLSKAFFIKSERRKLSTK